MLDKTGIPEKEKVMSAFPAPERLNRGSAAVIECFQSIPCNPCSTACKRGAIRHMDDINDLPKVDYDICNGCGLCAPRCPGLAIMIVDMTYAEDKALLKIPYEFLPLPEEGSVVTAVNRAGEPVCAATAVKVQTAASFDRTPMVWLAVDKAHVYDVRNFRTAPKEEPVEVTGPESGDISIMCRCNDLDVEYIRGLIAKGYKSVDEIKRISRLGMGPCQGRNCIPLVLNELSRALNKPAAELSPGAYRPAVRSVPLGAIADYRENDGGEGGA